jgi:hypothetical protein
MSPRESLPLSAAETPALRAAGYGRVVKCPPTELAKA